MPDIDDVKPRRGRPPTRGTETGEVVSLDRAASLLELLAEGEGLTLADLARRSGLPSSTVYRLLSTMHHRGLVGHDETLGLWTVGAGLFRIGSAYLCIRKLPDIARPIIRGLLAKVDETVNVSMLDRDELVCVAQAESHAPVRTFFRLGRRLPLHASAAGKAILAAATPALREELLGTAPLQRFTPQTHGTHQSLLAELEARRDYGWALDNEEHTPGMRCVSAAVLNEWVEPVAAVSISAPADRMPPQRLEILGGMVCRAAAALSRLYSGHEARPAPTGVAQSADYTNAPVIRYGGRSE